MASALEDVTKPGMFWTKNRISILIPWLTPLAISLFIAPGSLSLAFISFVFLSFVSWIVVALRSPFSEDSADSPKFREGVKLPDGSIVSPKEIRKTRYWMIFSLVLSFVIFSFVNDLLPILFPTPPAPMDPSLVVGGVLASFMFTFQALSKTYLIAKDLPLNGFPFFRSNNNTRNVTHWSDRKISTGVMDNPMNPSHPCNIGNPANPNYIFK